MKRCSVTSFNSENSAVSGILLRVMVFAIFLYTCFSGLPLSGENISVSCGTWPMFRRSRDLSARTDKIPVDIISIWSFDSGRPIRSGITVGSDGVFFGNEEGVLYALKRSSGRKLWKIDLEDSITASPLLLRSLNGEGDNDLSMVFVGTQSGVFMAVEKSSGDIVWSFDTGSRISGSATFFIENGSYRVVFGAYDFNLYCLDALTGELLWKAETNNFLNGTPAFSEDKLILGGCDGFLRIIDTVSGSATTYLDLRSYLPSSPVFYEGMVWVANYEGKVFAVDVNSMKIIWIYDGGDAAAFVPPLAVSAGHVLAPAQNGEIHIIEKKTGERHAAARVFSRITAGPIADDKFFMIADEDGFITIFDIETGAGIYSFEHGSGIRSQIAARAGRIYVGDEDGRLTVYGASENEGKGWDE